jgi:hypothetical protein
LRIRYRDEWRVKLVLRQHAKSDGGAYPRVLERRGTPPPQYPDDDDEGNGRPIT